MKHPYLVDLKTLAYPSTIAIKFLMELCIWELVDFIARTKRFISMIISIRIDDYKKTLIERFSNPKIRDRLPRLCLNGAAKIPKFVLGSLRDKLQLGGAIYYLSLTIAAWCLYLNGYDDQNRPMPIDDPLPDLLTQQARSGKTDPRPLLSIFEIFGDLVQSPRFVETVADKLSNLHEFGAKGTLVRSS